jgi:hypothetical protein
MDPFGILWFRDFKVFKEWGLSKSSSREEVPTIGCREDTW